MKFFEAFICPEAAFLVASNKQFANGNRTIMAIYEYFLSPLVDLKSNKNIHISLKKPHQAVLGNMADFKLESIPVAGAIFFSTNPFHPKMEFSSRIICLLS
jgi:hypothetical protein